MLHYRPIDWSTDYEAIVSLFFDYEPRASSVSVIQYVAKLKEFPFWVALIEDKIVGGICVAVHKHHLTAERVATKIVIYVKPECRSRGVAKGLIKTAKEFLQSHDVKYLLIDKEPLKIKICA